MSNATTRPIEPLTYLPGFFPGYARKLKKSKTRNFERNFCQVAAKITAEQVNPKQRSS